MNHNKNDELETLITQVAWEKAPESERTHFAKSFMQLEIAHMSRIKAETAKGAHLFSMITTLFVILGLLLLNVSPEGVVMIVAAVQLSLFGFSQLMEFFARKTVSVMEESTLKILKALVRKHPFE